MVENFQKTQAGTHVCAHGVDRDSCQIVGYLKTITKPSLTHGMTVVPQRAKSLKKKKAKFFLAHFKTSILRMHAQEH